MKSMRMAKSALMAIVMLSASQAQSADLIKIEEIRLGAKMTEDQLKEKLKLLGFKNVKSIPNIGAYTRAKGTIDPNGSTSNSHAVVSLNGGEVVGIESTWYGGDQIAHIAREFLYYTRRFQVLRISFIKHELVARLCDDRDSSRKRVITSNFYRILNPLPFGQLVWHRHYQLGKGSYEKC